MSSSKIPVTHGTVQGPILCRIFINDLPKYITHSKIRPFADDSIIYRQIKSQNDCLMLQEDLEAAIQWEQDWLMSFHPDKCNIMNITTKRTPIHFYYNMYGHILESVKHAKYLGITISSDLKKTPTFNKQPPKQTNLYVLSEEISKSSHKKLKKEHTKPS